MIHVVTSLNLKDNYLYLDVVLHEGCYLGECIGRVGNVGGEIKFKTADSFLFGDLLEGFYHYDTMEK